MTKAFPQRLDAPARSLRAPVRRALIGGALALAAGLAPLGCATSHAKGKSPEIVVHLTNNLTPPTDISVFAVSGDGFRRLLGDVPPNGHKVLHASVSGAAQTLRLVAQPPLGRLLRSQPFTISGSETLIDWDLQSNSLWFPSESPE
jgi:hypothetical protein